MASGSGPRLLFWFHRHSSRRTEVMKHDGLSLITAVDQFGISGTRVRRLQAQPAWHSFRPLAVDAGLPILVRAARVPSATFLQLSPEQEAIIATRLADPGGSLPSLLLPEAARPRPCASWPRPAQPCLPGEADVRAAAPARVQAHRPRVGRDAGHPSPRRLAAILLGPLRHQHGAELRSQYRAHDR